MLFAVGIMVSGLAFAVPTSDQDGTKDKTKDGTKDKTKGGDSFVLINENNCDGFALTKDNNCDGLA